MELLQIFQEGISPLITNTLGEIKIAMEGQTTEALTDTGATYLLSVIPS